jgi:hypothetical protein
MPIPESQTSMRAGEGTESIIIQVPRVTYCLVLGSEDLIEGIRISRDQPPNTETFSSDSQAQGLHIESINVHVQMFSKRNAVTLSNQ